MEFSTAQELRNRTVEQLEVLLQKRREELRHFRFQVAARSVKNHRQLRMLRQEIARILTVINHKKQIPAP